MRAPPSMMKPQKRSVRSRRIRSANHPAGIPDAAQNVPKMPSAMPTDWFGCHTGAPSQQDTEHCAAPNMPQRASGMRWHLAATGMWQACHSLTQVFSPCCCDSV